MLTILEMTATFGKLENKTLTLKPGMNILEAPNEWGKSTWCAFIAAMFYGIDTRERTTKDSLAGKEHYAPWSGKPMEGRMKLRLDGKTLILERTTAGRIPMGAFRAYWEETGLSVEGLTGENCGRLLLGVEKEVFLRSNFLRQWDLPVEDHAALRQRLQNLVTTGEENGEDLVNLLRGQKNRISYRGSGLLPKKEEQLAAAVAENDRQQALEEKIRQLETRLDAEGRERKLLQNHEKTLRYEAYTQRQEKIDAALTELDARYEKWQEIKNAPEPKKSFPLWVLPLIPALILLYFRYYIYAGALVAAAGLLLAVRPKREDNSAREQEALQAYQSQAEIADALQQGVTETAPPDFPDTCTLSREETRARLETLSAREGQTIRALGQLEGQRRPRRDIAPIEKQIAELKAMEQALELALETAQKVRQELQNRFAPGITRRAAELFDILTDGRYGKLTIREDLSLLTAPEGQVTLRSPLWCSDGTADALYFALRIALSEALCPAAPLILDDVFVRFDDLRLKNALSLLEKANAQVILFTCQGREKRIAD